MRLLFFPQREATKSPHDGEILHDDTTTTTTTTPITTTTTTITITITTTTTTTTVAIYTKRPIQQQRPAVNKNIANRNGQHAPQHHNLRSENHKLAAHQKAEKPHPPHSEKKTPANVVVINGGGKHGHTTARRDEGPQATINTARQTTATTTASTATVKKRVEKVEEREGGVQHFFTSVKNGFK